MRTITMTVGPLAAASPNNIALSQSASVAQSLTLNGTLATAGVAKTDTPRRVLITSAGNDSGMTFTIAGTNWSGALISETVAGGNIAAAASVLDYATVTSIKTSAATASTVTVGTNGVASSQWLRFDEYALPQGHASVVVTGTVSMIIEYSLDDPNGVATPMAPSAMTWFTSPATMSPLTGSTMFEIDVLPKWMRLTLQSGSGSAVVKVGQYGAVTA